MAQACSLVFVSFKFALYAGPICTSCKTGDSKACSKSPFNYLEHTHACRQNMGIYTKIVKSFDHQSEERGARTRKKVKLGERVYMIV